MNQILVTGEEKITENIQETKKTKKVLPTKGIVIFFAISIIILGICMAVGSLYAKTKINETVEANIKPEIIFERNDEDNTIEISIKHIRNITKATYKWNDEEEKNIDIKNSKNIETSIDLIGGQNKLTVAVTEENGQTCKLDKTYMAGNIPEIELEAVNNGVKVIASNEDKIAYVQYSWDDGEIQKIEVDSTEYEGIINAPKGPHKLNIEVVDINNMKAKKETTVIGDTEPTVNVESKLVDGKTTFVIDAEDDENIKTITIIHNGGEKQTIDVNEKTYHKEITMTEGETNTLIVTVTNENNLQKTRRIKFDNK